MSDLTRYRPKAGKYIGGSMEQVLGNLRVAENGGDIAEVVDALEHWVPDTTLQDIADAWTEYKEFAAQSGAMPVLRERMDAALEGTDDVDKDS